MLPPICLQLIPREIYYMLNTCMTGTTTLEEWNFKYVLRRQACTTPMEKDYE
jgi:hypothetical protein